jgi:hypothetical protein
LASEGSEEKATFWVVPVKIVAQDASRKREKAGKSEKIFVMP